MLIIDGDGHFVERPGMWKEYFPKALADQLEVTKGDDGRTSAIIIGDYVLISDKGFYTEEHPFGPGDFLTSGGAKHREHYGRTYDQAEPGGWDPSIRLKVHDENGIHAAVLFSSMGLMAGANPDQDLAEATCQAVNTWVHDEYTSAAPDEIFVVATLPYQDPDRAAKELRRCVEELGFVGGQVFTSPNAKNQVLGDPAYDVLYATAVELDVPICVHSGATRNPKEMRQLTGDRPGGFLSQRAAIHTFESMYHFGTMYEGRVFDRHPHLRVGYMESGCGWAPYWTERLKEAWEAVGWNIDPPIARGAVDVFRDQCIVGCEGEESMVGYVQEFLSEDSVLWASDYPHWDTEPPYTKDMLERTDLTPSQLEAVMALATVKFYRLDVDAVRRSHEKRGSLLVVE